MVIAFAGEERIGYKRSWIDRRERLKHDGVHQNRCAICHRLYWLCSCCGWGGYERQLCVTCAADAEDYEGTRM